jgi:cytochrome c-type biogenesis protein CcmH
MHRLRAGLLALAFLALPLSAHAVRPDEVLQDQALEERARGLSALLRCMVCQNQSIDDSDAELARDLRLLVRERLVAGDTDEQVIDYLVSRYGEFVLLKPRFSTGTLMLWITPLAVLLIGGAGFFAYARRRAPDSRPAVALSDAEKERIEKILDQGR